ncbi:MAG TPA: choice-of-anchor J domain-containing protein, partial [Candidatus Syntrophosphaera sp.]|nr:choice-of-anchor J domain-containing protein [Candidatus Syntrophosphaera sp.]
MKRTLLLCLLLAIVSFAVADTFTIGDGTGTQSYVPFYGLYDYGWSKSIYTAAEINAAGLTGGGNLIAIGFDVGNTPNNYVTTNQMVYLRHTTASVYDTGDNTLPDSTLFTLVFQGDLTWNGGGWHHVMFSTPFAWNGTDNIEIMWRNWDGTWGSGYPNFRFTTTNPDYCAVYKYQDNSFPADATGTRYYSRPNLQLVTPQTTPPSPAVAIYPTLDGWTFTDGTLSWQSGGGMPSSYDVHFGTSATPPFIQNQPGTTYTPVLEPNTTYYWQIVPVNNIGPAVDCPVWSFKTPSANQIAESFEDTSFPPMGWTNVDDAFTRSTTSPFHGSATAYEYIGSAGSILYTPMLSIDANSNLDFWARSSATSGIGRIQIKYSQNGTDWLPVGAEIAFPENSNWNNYVVDLSSVTPGNYFLGFNVYSSSTSSTSFYLDHIFGPEMAALAPGAAVLTAPANLATDVSAWPTFTWNAGPGGIPTGFRLYCDTNANPTTLLADVPVNTYTATAPLNYSTTYYWKVVAYNATGEAPASEVFSFTTRDDPVVNTFPWIVDFGTVSADWPVLNWSQLSGFYPTPTGTTSQWFRDDWLNGETGNNAAKINIYGTSRYGWLVTPPINIPAGDYELKFDAALMAWNNNNPPTGTQADDRFLVIVADNPNMNNPTVLREWNNTGSNDVFNSIPTSGQNYSIALTGLTGVKYFAFYGESTVSGNGDNDLMVDNVTVQQVMANPIFSITPESHDFGSLAIGATASQDFTISNIGEGTLGINSITISTNPMLTLANLPTLPASVAAGQNISFTVNYAPTAAGTHTATVTITDNLGAKAVHTVNITGTATEDMDPPTNLTATVTGNNVHLDWDAPGETPPPPAGFSDGFETYADFSLTFDPWTLVDVDQSGTYGMTGYSWPNVYAPMAYMIFNPGATTPPLTDLTAHGGSKMAACFAAVLPSSGGNGPNNDWMISPAISPQAGDFLNFYAKSYTADYGLERFKVGVSTGGTAPADFTIISGTNYIQPPVDWTLYSYDLSAYAGQNIRFGIQCVSNDAFIFLVDDVSVGPVPTAKEVYAANTAGTATRCTGTPVPAPRIVTPTRELLGYKVYRDGALIQTITGSANSEYDDLNLEIGTYSYTVTAVYTSGESEPAGPVTATVTPPADPPLDLAATVDGNDVTLTWTSPEAPQPGEWITWCQDVLGNGIGTNSAIVFDVAHRFDQTDLAAHQGGSVTQVKFVPNYADCVYTVKVWTGGSATNAGTLVSSQVVPTVELGAWNLVVLNTPVPLPTTGDLYVGYEVNTQGDHPAGCDGGPVVEGKGNMMYFNGQWTTLTALAASLTYNWLIQTFVADAPTLKAVELTPIPEHQQISYTSDPLSLETKQVSREPGRALTGFRVYRDGVQIGAINDPGITTFSDYDLPNGDYVYGVTAVYTTGESEPATVNVTVNVQLAEIIMNEGFETYDDFALIFAPWTLLDQDGQTTYGFQGIEFPGSGSAMAYIIFNPSATTPPITTLTPHGGAKMAASFAANPAPNNDWMVTPRIHLGTNSAVKFYVKSHTANYGLERYRVGVSTLPNIIPQGFQYVSGPDFVEAPTNWTEVVYDLSSYDNQSVYIAIRCVSNDAFVFYVDDFTVHSNGGHVSNEDPTVPALQTSLNGNYPNPFNP